MYIVYTKISCLMAKRNDIFLRIIIHMHVHVYKISYTSAYLSMYCALPRTELIFLVFEGSFFEAPRVLLFHATAIYAATMIEDASIFILE